MKTIKLSLVALGLLATQVFALTTQEVEKQIKEIETLPQSERVEKMNELKIELHKLSEQERHEIMTEITQKHHIEHNTNTDLKNKIDEHIKDSHKKDDNEAHEIENHEFDKNYDINKHEMEINDHNHNVERDDKVERNDHDVERDDKAEKKDHDRDKK